MLRSQVLKMSLSESPEATLRRSQLRKARFLERLEKPESSPLGARAELVSHGVGLAIFQHLGFGSVDQLIEELNESFNLVLNDFSGDWWKAYDDARYVFDRGASYPVQGWYDMWMKGLLLADWTDRWDEGMVILEWVNDDVSRGTSHGDPSLNLFLFVASTLGQRVTNHADVESLVAKIGNKYEKLIVPICQAVANRDSEQFATTLPPAVKQFHKSVAEDVPNIEFWVSLDLSLLWTFASRFGLELPTLKPKEDATIVRKESIGL